ncbi:hypothetical protein QN362_06150 [Actimicrobium sp. CCC2.4]|nr:hypothetical protein [Actimicrobium sp. CCC2.4]
MAGSADVGHAGHRDVLDREVNAVTMILGANTMIPSVKMADDFFPRTHD